MVAVESPGTAALTEMPTAVRLRRPGWRDPRLWVGVLLVAGSMVLGANVVGNADETAPVWAVRADLAAGSQVRSGDLRLTRVRFADGATAARYFAGSDPLPTGSYLRTGVAAGELLPRAAVGGAAGAATQVSVSVPGSQVPPSIGTGSQVDVWVLPPPGAPDGARARLAVSGVAVLEAPEAGSGLVGAGSDRQLVLGLAEDEPALARVLTASGSGRLMLVARG